MSSKKCGQRVLVPSIIFLIVFSLLYNWHDISAALPVTHTLQRIDQRTSFLSGGCESDQSGKTLVAIMRAQNRPIQPQLVDLYKAYLRSTDFLLTHPNYNNWNYALMLPGMKGAEFFSLAELQLSAAILKAKGASFVSYDLETAYSPPVDSSDPTASMRQASQIAHQNGLKLIAAPSKSLTDKYYSSFAPLADIYILQAQAYQSNSSQYKGYVDSIIPKLRTAHAGMPVITELSTARGDLQSMKQSFSSVADMVDGVTTWYSNTPQALAQLTQFLAWFHQNYR